MDIINFLDHRWLMEILENIEKEPGNFESFLELAELVKNACGRSSIVYYDNIWSGSCGHGLFGNVIYGALSQHADLRDLFVRLYRVIDEADIFNVDFPMPGIYKSEAHWALHNKNYGGLIFKEKENLHGWNDHSMVLVNNKDDIKLLFRKLSIYHGLSYDDFYDHLPNCFPDIFFMEDGIDFSKADICEKQDNFLSLFIKDLSYLNDCAKADFLDNPQSFENKAQEHNVTLSRESTSTKNNKSAVKERTKTIGGKDVFFELHTKLKREKGRIHFHIGSNLPPEIERITNGHLIVGIICKHLAT